MTWARTRIDIDKVTNFECVKFKTRKMGFLPVKTWIIHIWRSASTKLLSLFFSPTDTNLQIVVVIPICPVRIEIGTEFLHSCGTTENNRKCFSAVFARMIVATGMRSICIPCRLVQWCYTSICCFSTHISHYNARNRLKHRVNTVQRNKSVLAAKQTLSCLQTVSHHH